MQSPTPEVPEKLEMINFQASRTTKSEQWVQGVVRFLGPLPPSYPSHPDTDDLVGSRRPMLRYYTVTLVFLLTTNLENNCFLSGMSLWIRGVTLA